MSNFITNNQTKSLHQRLIELISKSYEMKFLVGFFYFSGLKELYESFKINPNAILKVLVGLNVDKTNKGLIEYADNNTSKSGSEIINEYFNAIKKSINSDLFDNREFYEQVKFFIKMLESQRLLIRKTREPNHSKLYLFYLNETGRNRIFITGSSNLTKSGLITQNEFNVEISDYGFDEAEKYFDRLWNLSLRINEDEDNKERLISLIKNQTHIKEISPFEAYALILKSYLDTYQHKDISSVIIRILEKSNYNVFKYQIDAIKQALAIIENHNGVLIADVVGLGKTIVACAVAKSLK
ncbi:MAG: phospholipase D-like domain-containing protein, partial [Ignavibacteria bacterium]